MNHIDDLPNDFLKCAHFHGHVCPGLAIGYAAAKAASRILGVTQSEDEEIVTIVENDSCAVDAIQVLLGCTFGKGNLIFRDWGKQVYTVMDRKTGRGLRVSFRGPVPGHAERNALKAKIDSGKATDADKDKWLEIRRNAVQKLISADPEDFFDIREIEAELPPPATIVETRTCEICGEPAMITRMVERNGRLICCDCAQCRA